MLHSSSWLVNFCIKLFFKFSWLKHKAKIKRQLKNPMIEDRHNLKHSINIGVVSEKPERESKYAYIDQNL